MHIRAMSKRSSLGEIVKKGPLENETISPADGAMGKDDEAKRPKFSFGYGKKGDEKSTELSSKKGIQIKLGTQKTTHAANTIKSQSQAVAAAFNVDDDEEPEEMPPEARMRMRNIGRETPTSAGPNSFGKTKQGFCDAKKIFEKTMKKAMENEGSRKD